MAEALRENGLQEGVGQPVVLELDPAVLDEEGIQALGYMVFTSCPSLKEHVRRVLGPGDDEPAAATPVS